MNKIEKEIWQILEKNNFKISIDTRKEMIGAVFFAIKGDNFDGNDFTEEALKKGAVLVVSDRPKNKKEKVLIVKDVLETLQNLSSNFRQNLKIPIIVIGGSNGKTTSKDLAHIVLSSNYKVSKTEGSFNNHIGVPLSLFSIEKDAEIALIEVGANHHKEHTKLLNIIKPTHVVVTNNGLDHMEGFGSPKGVRVANAEIYDYARKNQTLVFVDKNEKDLMTDSQRTKRILYPTQKIKIIKESPLVLEDNRKKYKTKLFGGYNLKNINLALAIGNHFGVKTDKALKAICSYEPKSKRSQILNKDQNKYILDCYNANPSSMYLSIKSFLEMKDFKKGLILGDMLELGKYSQKEHKKIIEFVQKNKFDQTIFIGPEFKKVLAKLKPKFSYHHFDTSEEANVWFMAQNFSGFSFLLKGSRGIRVEKVIEERIKKLSLLLSQVEVADETTWQDTDVSYICFDSRKAMANSLFVAINGTNQNGNEFIDSAILNGAKVIVHQNKIKNKKENVQYIEVKDSRKALSLIAQNFYDNPSRKLKLVGVTGTNGKTTTATLLFDLFKMLGFQTAKITTIENQINNDVYPATETTPDPINLNKFLATALALKVSHVFMECSSHAIDQKRIFGLEFIGGIFTNLTLDHLDYHKTIENYAEVKKSFFDNLSKQSFALSNLDDSKGEYMLEKAVAKKYFFSLETRKDFNLEIIKTTTDGMLVKINGKKIILNLIGKFNAYNILGVFATAKLLGIKKSVILKNLSKIKPPKGRLELIKTKQKILGVIDYAHTPDALLNVLNTLKETKQDGQKIITVVGCGGDRDKSKRPIMGQIACKYSDFVIFTADNSRSEETSDILKDITDGLTEQNFQCIENRKVAIKVAYKKAKKGDIVLIAGKGHENYQILKNKTTHFSDSEEFKNNTKK